MRVTVKLFGNLRRHLPPGQGKIELTLAPGASVGVALHELGIDDGELGLSAVNGVAVDDEHRLDDGDGLEIFPPMAGG